MISASAVIMVQLQCSYNIIKSTEESILVGLELEIDMHSY